MDKKTLSSQGDFLRPSQTSSTRCQESRFHESFCCICNACSRSPRALSATSQRYRRSAECLARDQASSFSSPDFLKSAGGAPGLHLVLICGGKFFSKKDEEKFPVEYLLFPSFPPCCSVEAFREREKKVFFFLFLQRDSLFFLKWDAGNSSSPRSAGLRSARIYIRVIQ